MLECEAETVEPIAPMLAVPGEPVVELDEGLSAKGVHAPLPIGSYRDEACLKQNSEVARDPRLMNARFVDDLSDLALTDTQRFDDSATGRVGQRLEQIIKHDYAYAYQCIYRHARAAARSCMQSRSARRAEVPLAIDAVCSAWCGCQQMPILPSERLSIRAAAPAAEILNRLRAEVEPFSWFRLPFSRDHKAFQGEVVGDRFKLTRIIHYRNSFLPTIVGTVRPDEAGTAIDITLRLNPFVAGFMTFWFGCVACVLAATVVWAVAHQAVPILFVVPVVMLLFGYVLMHGAFRYEATKAKRFFEELGSRSLGVGHG